MQDVIGVGLIGCGNMGQIHAASLARLAEDGVALRAVSAADPSPSARAAAARNWPFERLHDDPAVVLADPEVDAVFICTPTALHHELYLAAIDSIRAGTTASPGFDDALVAHAAVEAAYRSAAAGEVVRIADILPG